MTITPQQVGSMPISGLQAPSVPMQAGSLPATTMQIDLNAIMNMMLIMVIMVMMMKVMTGVTERV